MLNSFMFKSSLQQPVFNFKPYSLFQATKYFTSISGKYYPIVCKKGTERRGIDLLFL